MPFINTKLSVGLSCEKEAKIKSALGEAIALLPGKSEKWLMLNFETDCRLWFAGTNDAPSAYIEVSIFGSADAGDYEALTGAITKIISAEAGVPADRIYVKYEESKSWGFNGSNF